MPTLHLSGDPDADRLLSDDPLALLIGMLLDQRVPMETATGSVVTGCHRTYKRQEHVVDDRHEVFVGHAPEAHDGLGTEEVEGHAQHSLRQPRARLTALHGALDRGTEG